jgi:hypothetical protein
VGPNNCAVPLPLVHGGAQEVSKVASDVKDHGLSLVIFGEWYHVESMNQVGDGEVNTNTVLHAMHRKLMNCNLDQARTNGCPIPAQHSQVGCVGVN